MRIYSYVVARDFGFAPNPFFGYCTLATCKPDLRRFAAIGDWIVGIGSQRKQRSNHLVFAMQVDEVMSYNDYWDDERFLLKKPNMRSSLRNAYGDNIYHTRDGQHWIQLDSHHSLPDGTPCADNMRQDTKTNRVLISQHFSYWGGSGPTIPPDCRAEMCRGRGCKKVSLHAKRAVLGWLKRLEPGYCGVPLEWPTS